MKHIITTLRQIGFMTTALMLAMVGTFVHATWSEPTGTPPNNNTDAPINVGSTAQVKSGSLSVDGFAVFGDQVIEDGNPTIEFSDNTASHRDWWIHVNSNYMYFLADRDDDGRWTGESPWPLYMLAGTTDADDVAIFSNQVRAREYCDRTAANCFTPGDSASFSGYAVQNFTYSAPRTNNSNRPMYVYVYGSTGGTPRVEILPPGRSWTRISNSSGGAFYDFNFVVPPGFWYRVAGNSDPLTVVEVN